MYAGGRWTINGLAADTTLKNSNISQFSIALSKRTSSAFYEDMMNRMKYHIINSFYAESTTSKGTR
jgi:hypothetical protein